MNVVFSEAIRRYGAPYVGNLCGAIIAGLAPFCERCQITEINDYWFKRPNIYLAQLYLEFSDTSQIRYRLFLFLPVPETATDDWTETAIAFVYLLLGLDSSREFQTRYRRQSQTTVSFSPRWNIKGPPGDKDLPRKLALTMIEGAKEGMPVVANVAGFPVVATAFDSPAYMQELIEQTLVSNTSPRTEKPKGAYRPLIGGLRKNDDGTYEPMPFDDVYTFSEKLVAQAQSRGDVIVGKFNGIRFVADVWNTPQDVAAKYFRVIRLRLRDNPLDNVQDATGPETASLCPYTTTGRRIEI